MAAGKKKAKSPPDVGELVAAARAAILESGAVKVTALGPATARAPVASALAEQGFEVTRTWARRPLVAQLAEALAGGTPVPLKSLGSFIRGGAGPELALTAAAAVEQGLAHRVLRGTAEYLVPMGTEVLSREEIASAHRHLKALEKVFAKVAKPSSASLLREDVAADFRERFATIFKVSAGSEMSEVLRAVDAVRDVQVGLSFIPKVIARLRPWLPVEKVRRLLEDAADQGLIELRPEGGLNRLTQEELALCVPGPQGTRLSWARRLQGGMS